MQKAAISLNSKTVEDLLDQDLKVCESLLTFLDDEKKALKEKDIETLEGILEKKAQCLSHLEKSADIRTKWIFAYQAQIEGETDNTMGESWEALIETLREPNLSTKWERLKNLIVACKTQNEVNGKVISRNQQTFGRLLNIVRGQTQSTSLYTAGGSKQDSQLKQQIGEA